MWNEPQTWVDGASVADADTLNRQLRDNMRALAPAPGWVLVQEMLNGWSSLDAARPARFRRDGRQVSLGGMVKGGTPSMGAAGTAFVLPADCRPEYRSFFGTVTGGNTSGVLEVYPTGEVRCEVGNGLYFALDGISFPVGV